jgi:hypothetical protein
MEPPFLRLLLVLSLRNVFALISARLSSLLTFDNIFEAFLGISEALLLAKENTFLEARRGVIEGLSQFLHFPHGCSVET